MQIRLSAGASEYLRNERTYLRQHSLAASKAFVTSMRRALSDLSRFAQAGFEADGLPMKASRRLVRNGYRIDYTIHANDVWVFAISSSVNTPMNAPGDDPDYES